MPRLTLWNMLVSGDCEVVLSASIGPSEALRQVLHFDVLVGAWSSDTLSIGEDSYRDAKRDITKQKANFYL